MKFFDTHAGFKFAQGTIPSLITTMKDLTQEIKRANDLKEEELQQTKNK